MNEFKVNCPCCNKEIVIQLDDSKNITVFFNVQNQEELRKIAVDNGIELGMLNGGEK